MKSTLCFILLFVAFNNSFSQTLTGIITYSNVPVNNAIITINKREQQFFSDSSGRFKVPFNKKKLTIHIQYPGFIPSTIKLSHITKDTLVHIDLLPDTLYFQEIDIVGTQPLISKKPDAFNTEVYSACILSSSSASNLFEGAQNIAGLRPQLNCNICNTGDIHINGMEGPYTNILIDGMPVIGGIASVYGLSGIAADIIEKIELNRYPGSVIYGIDNIAGTLNIITKQPTSSRKNFYLQLYSSTYLDNNVSFGVMQKMKHYSYVNSCDITYFDKVFDVNKDGFTDVTLQKRISAFHKSLFKMKDSSNLCVISRILLEDRWGGQTHWNKNFRGSDSIYGESIYTNRYESIIKLPLKIKKINLENNLSYNYHHQNSYYGKLFFDAHQHNLYYQSFFSHSFNILHSLSGLAFRYLYYKDNTAVFKNSSAFNVWIIPSVYTENTLSFNKHFQSILALRYDYHNVHKSIYTPRMMLLWTPLSLFTIRSGFTTGFRPVQLFTEDHAALTGARKIVIQNNLLPEKSYTAYYNIQSNILHKQYFQLSTDINMWYVYFSNRIVPDYSHADKIIYSNLNKNDYSINRGVSVQLQINYHNHLQSVFSLSFFDNYVVQSHVKKRIMLSEPWSANWIIRWMKNKIRLEYTGSIYGSMILPKAGALDPRPDKSPVYSIQNMQATYSFKKTDITIGVKNILNFTPDKNIPFLISRAHDPFDKKVQWDTNGNPVATSENPYALTFDPTYTYASMQKRRMFISFNLHF